jgi:hypothetical protein
MLVDAQQHAAQDARLENSASRKQQARRVAGLL